MTLTLCLTSFLLFCCAANIHAFTWGSHLGYCSGANGSFVHPGLVSHLLTSDSDDTRAKILTRPSQRDFRILITDGELYSSFGRHLRKPSFLFDDALVLDNKLLTIG